MFFQRHVLRDVKRQRRFTHGRTRRHQNQIGRLQPARNIIETGKSGRQTGNPAFIRIFIGDIIQLPLDDFTDRRHLLTAFIFRHFQNAAFGGIDDLRHFAFAGVRFSRDRIRGENQTAQARFFQHDLRMPLDVEGGNKMIRQVRHVADAADIIQLSHAAQFFRHRQDVDILVVKNQIIDRFKNDRVGFPIKIGRL